MKKNHVVRVEIHFTPIAGFFIALMLFQLAFPCLFVSKVCAANLYVNAVNDELDGKGGNGYCSLREAIMNANNDDKGQGDCIEGDGADVIFLLAGTYTLAVAGSNEDANVTGDLDIYGNVSGAGGDGGAATGGSDCDGDGKQIPEVVNGCGANSTDPRGVMRIAPCDIGAYENGKVWAGGTSDDWHANDNWLSMANTTAPAVQAVTADP